MEDLTILCDRIRLLVERRPTAPADDVEHTLTDGYARALALEGEQLRARERVHALAGSPDHVDELRALKGKLDCLDRQVAELRGLLGALAGTL
ncbi:MAG: hypothetical protein ACRDOP_00895 [Gaiellaceae bacterium]